jgi:uncharacterized membrane protein
MLIAAETDFAYRALLLLHILSIIVAFAPGFVVPVISSRLKREGKSIAQNPDMANQFATNSKQVHGPALVLAGLFGFGLIGASDQAWKFSQNWISIALVLWFVMLAVLFALLIPAERKAGRGDEAAEQRVAMFGGMMHVLLLLMLIDMIWKPGIPT